MYRIKRFGRCFRSGLKLMLPTPHYAAHALPKRVRRALASRLVLACLAGLTFGMPVEAADRSVHTFSIPNSVLQRADGKGIPLGAALSDGRPVVLTFMFSSCQTVCPVNNQVLVELEQLLGAKRERVNLVSISIDPDHDSVQRLAAYAKRTGHKGSFFTGDPGSSEAVQRAFESWRGDKQNHEPVFFLSRAAGAKARWVRLGGFVTPRELLAELNALAPELALITDTNHAFADSPIGKSPNTQTSHPARRKP
jgi:protein SCO1